MDALTPVSAVVAVASAVVAAVLGYWAQRRLRTMERRSLMGAYGDSLAWAAFDLQSRLFNILHGTVIDRSDGPGRGFLTAFLLRGSEDERVYARRSTVFVLAEYLGWVEILRRDVQFLNLGRTRTNRAVMLKVNEVSDALNHTSPDSNELRLFRSQQRAIGELMIHPDGEPGRRRCLGYAEFSARLGSDDDFRGWLEPLFADVDRVAEDTGPAVDRLEKIQRRLIGLIDLLDPRRERFPQHREAFDHERHVLR